MFRVLLPHLNGILSKRPPNEKAQIQAHSSDPLLYSPPASAFVGAALGCLTTLYLSAFGMAPAIASALATALLCGQVLVIRTTGLLPGELFTSIYGGAFGGMTASLWRLAGAPFDQSYLEIGALWISLSLFCGLAFGIVTAIDSRSSRPIAFGYGGRSGAIAAIACFIYLQLASWTTGDELFRVADADQTDIDATSASLTCIACLMGTFATLLVLRRFDFKFDKIADRTFIASTVALFGLTALHLMGLNGALDAFYAGCFLGMSTPERLKGRIEPFLGAVLLSVVLVQVKRLLPGVGGSLGLAAFVTVWMLVTLKRIASRPASPDPSTSHLTTSHLTTSHPTPSVDATTAIVPIATPAGVSPGVAREGSFTARPMRTIAGASLAALAVGCLLLPSKRTEVLDTTTVAQVASEPSPVPQQLALLQANLAPEAERPFEAPSVAAVGSDVSSDHAEQAVERIAQAAEASANPSSPATSDVPPLRASEPARGEVSGGATESSAKLFHDFQQWRASLPSSTADSRPVSLRQVRHRAQVAGVTTAASTPLPRARERQPDRLIPPAAIGPAPVQRAHTHRPIAPQAAAQPSTGKPSP
jgi:hypothetical protein